jgi:tetratricopeptide (TPR) repeat protein
MPRKLTTAYFVLAVFLFSVMLLGIQRINYVKRIKSARSYVNLGNTSFVNSNFDNAISDYNEALLLNPKDATAYLQRGLAYVMKMDLDKAIDNFSESIHLNPKGATAYFERGSLYDAKGEYDNAINDYNEALRIDPKNIKALLKRGNAYSKKEELENAITDYNQVLQLDPTNARAYSSRGIVYRKKGEFDKALKDFSDGIRLNPKDGQAFNNFAWFRATCADDSFRNGKEAVELATNACELTQWKSWFCISTLGAACAEAGDFENAVKYQKQALAMFGATGKNQNDEQQRLDLYEQNKPYHEALKAAPSSPITPSVSP